MNKISLDKIKKDLPDNNNIFIKPIIHYYLVAGFLLFLLILGELFILFGTNWRFIYKLLSGFFLIPPTLGIVLFLVIRFFIFDFHRIRGKIIISVSDNYIIANFLCPNKIIKKRVELLKSGGNTFSIGKELYIFDKKTIWFDTNKSPNVFFIPGLPNSIDFDLSSYIQKNLGKEQNDSTAMVKFSSESLNKFTSDISIAALQGKPDKEMGQAFIIMAIIIILLIIAIVVLAIMTGNKTPLVILQNVTG